MRLRIAHAVAVACVVVVGAVAAGVAASPAAAHGCTPGFWKNHVEFYVEDASLASIGFTNAPASVDTLLTALQYGGGPTLVAKKQILLRAAVATYLNYTIVSGDFNARIPASLGGDGDTSLAEFVAIVNAALASTDAGYIIDLAAWLDFKNNEGPAALCA